MSEHMPEAGKKAQTVKVPFEYWGLRWTNTGEGEMRLCFDWLPEPIVLKPGEFTPIFGPTYTTAYPQAGGDRMSEAAGRVSIPAREILIAMEAIEQEYDEIYRLDLFSMWTLYQHNAEWLEWWRANKFREKSLGEPPIVIP